MYVEVITLQGATAAEVGSDNAALIIGKVTSIPDSITTDYVEATSLSELEAQGFTDAVGGIGYRAAKSFFAGNGAMPRAAKLYFYPFTDDSTTYTVEKEKMLGSVNASNETFQAQASPCSVTKVYIKWTTTGDYIEQPLASWTPGWLVDSVVGSGEIAFSTAADVLYRDALGYSLSRVTDLGSSTYPDAQVFCNYSYSGLASILKTVRAVDVVHWMFAYDETAAAMAADYYTGIGGSWLLDAIVGYQEDLVCKQAGKDRLFHMSMPRDVEPTDTIASNLRTGIASMTYEEIPNVVGSGREVLTQQEVVTANGIPTNNVTATIMGMIAGQYPLSNDITLLNVPISQITFPLDSVADKWQAANINVIIEDAAHYPGEKLMSSALTLGGSGIEAYVEYQVCAIKVAKEVRAAMLDLIRSKRAKVDKNGCLLKNAILTSVINRLTDEGVAGGMATFADDGVYPIVDPLLNKFKKAVKTAEDTAYISFYTTRKRFASTQLNWKWKGNVATMTIVLNAVV